MSIAGDNAANSGKNLYVRGDKDWLLNYFKELREDKYPVNEYLRILINARRE